MSGARFTVYQDKAGGWRWRLRAANNRIIADSGESYTRQADAERAVDGVLQAAVTIAVKGDTSTEADSEPG